MKMIQDLMEYLCDQRIKWRYKQGVKRAVRAVKKDNELDSDQLRQKLKH